MFQKAVDYFIPDDFGGGRDIEKKRAELAVKTVIFMVVWGPITMAFSYLTLHSLPIALAVVGGTLCVAVAPFALRATRNMKLAGNLILLPFYALIVGLAFVSGGIQAAALSWLALVPMFALLFFGARQAMIWMTITLLTWVAVFAADIGGFPFGRLIGGQNDEACRLIEMGGL